MDKITETIFTHLPYDLFTDKDIAALTADKNDNSRQGLIKRALKKHDIIRIKRGLYCLAKKYQRRSLNKFCVAQILYGPSYISLESALSYHGWIPEGVISTTSVSMARSKIFNTPIGTFDYKRVIQNKFYEDVRYSQEQDSSFFIASPLKALCDYVYVNKKTWRSTGPLKQSLRIEDETLATIKKDDIEKQADNYHSRRVISFLNGIKKDLQL